jgi:dTMP kinase
MPTGRLITIEGIEGSGKTRHAASLAAYLEARGRRTCLSHEPGATKAGARIRDIFLDPALSLSPGTELFLVLADRCQHVREKLKPALARGEIVVCDRYSDSTLAYQGYGRGFDLDLLGELNRLAADGLNPHLTIILDCPVELGLERARKRSDDKGRSLDRFESETVEFHERVRRGFLALAARDPRRIRVIDSTAPLETVDETIARMVEQWLETQCP